MIGEVLLFLKNHLNEHLSAQANWVPGESHQEKVLFVDGEKMDPISFKLEAVSVLLINIEEETALRPADPYVSVSPQGNAKVHPEIRMNLYVLFVARFKQYEKGLNSLSQVIQHFQNHRIFDHQSAPELSDSIEKLTLELITLPLSEQNELWNSLRTTYHPSVLYKVRMIVFRDQAPAHSIKIKERKTDIEDKGMGRLP
ncbi:MAG: DUF4255 domain-containing protein [Gammaproteobacteria bacterium]|nr:DUF4255 domain-containing protein [Gammaproteobacteria bacterium]